MKSTVEKLSSLQRKLNVAVPQAVVDGAFQKIFQSIQRQVEIKGFRKGKAPLTTIKSMYGDRVRQDVAQDLIQNHYAQALSEHKLEPIGSPEFEFEDPKEAKDFSFTAQFDVRPEIKLKKYEGLEVEKEKYEKDEKKIEQVLENIRSSRATLIDVLEDRPAQLTDTAIVDFEGIVDGKPLENGSGQGHQLELGSNSFIDGFEQGIVGMKIGGEKTIDLKFPDPYHSKELAGKPVTFKVKLTGLKKKSLPELNEDFLKSLGGPSDVEGLKNAINEDIERSEKNRIEETFKNHLLKALVKANPVEVPPSLLKEQKKALVDDFHKRMHDQGLSHAEFEAYVQKWDKDFENTAAEMIQASFLVDTIARDHDLVCKKEDVEKRFEEYAKHTGRDVDWVRQYYAQEGRLSRLTYIITEEKVVAFLTKAAKIKDVPMGSLKEQA